MRKLLLLLLLLTAAPFPLAAAVGPEFELSQPVLGGAPEAQFEPSIASNGSDYFAVWLDQRDGQQALFGSRVAQDGSPVGATMRFASESAWSPRVVWNGSQYVVVWYESLRGLSVVRIAADGTLIDDEPLQPLSLDFNYYGTVAAGNSRTLIVTLTRDGKAVATILDTDANVIANVALRSVAPYRMAATWNGHSFVVALIDACAGCNVAAHFTFLSPDGLIESTSETAAVLYDGNYSIGALPDRILIAGATSTKGYNAWIFDNHGAAVTGTLGFAWNTPATGLVSIATEESSFVLAWPERNAGDDRILAMRMGPGGTGSPTSVIASAPGSITNPVIARSTAGDFVVAWNLSDDSGVASDVYARSLSAALAPAAEPKLLTISAAAQFMPSAGTNGTTWLVAWWESGSGGQRIVARRFAVDGTPIDAAPIDVSTPANFNGWVMEPPAIASNGHDYLLVWRDEAGVVMRRLRVDGVWLDDAPKQIAADSWSVTSQATAWNGREYFVVWAQPPSQPSYWGPAIVGAKITTDGSVSEPVEISHVEGGSMQPVVAPLGNDWLVVWTYTPPYPCQILCPAGDSDVVGARVTAEGVVVDPIPIQFSIPNALATDYASSPSIASSGSAAFIAWETYTDVRETYMTADGRIYTGVGGNGERVVTIGQWADKSIAWDGRRALITVLDAAEDGSAIVTLYGGGAPMELSRGVVSTRYRQYLMSLAARPGGKALVVYPRIMPGDEYGSVSRLFARVISDRERTHPIRR